MGIGAGFWKLFVHGCPLGCGQLALEGVHHPSWANTSPKKFWIGVKRENPFSLVGWLISGAGPGRSDEVSFRCAKEQSRCVERIGGGSIQALQALILNSSQGPKKACHPHSGWKHPILSSTLSFCLTWIVSLKTKMILSDTEGISFYFSLSSRRKEKSVERKSEDAEKEGIIGTAILRGEWKRWAPECKEEIHFPLR